MSWLRGKENVILTSITIAGVIGTGISAAYQTPKALARRENVEIDRWKKHQEGLLEDYKMTKPQQVVAMLPCYVPTILIACGTVATILGTHAHNVKTQAALISAYTLVDRAYKQYQDTNIELYGVEVDKRIRSRNASYGQYADIVLYEGEELFYDEFSGHFFKSTMPEVLNAEQFVNDQFSDNHYCELGTFYDYLGIETPEYGWVLGWSEKVGRDTYGYTWVHFEHELYTGDNDVPYTIIRMPYKPTVDFYFGKELED